VKRVKGKDRAKNSRSFSRRGSNSKKRSERRKKTKRGKGGRTPGSQSRPYKKCEHGQARSQRFAEERGEKGWVRKDIVLKTEDLASQINQPFDKEGEWLGKRRGLPQQRSPTHPLLSVYVVGGGSKPR